MNDFKKVALDAAREAGKTLLRLSSEKIRFSMKNQFDILAEADLQSERIIISKIKENFPQHSILSEEGGEDIKSSGYLWIVDPVDGTINFSRNMEEYCISIALSFKSKLILGVIFQPALGKMYVAERGKGAYLNGEKICVSKEKDLINTIAATDNSSNLEARMKGLSLLAKVGEEVRHVRIFGSCALHLAKIAEGKLDFYFKAKFNHWDYAAGILILEESGGQITDFDGIAYSKESKDIIASNKVLHSKVLKLLKNH